MKKVKNKQKETKKMKTIKFNMIMELSSLNNYRNSKILKEINLKSHKFIKKLMSKISKKLNKYKLKHKK